MQRIYTLLGIGLMCGGGIGGEICSPALAASSKDESQLVRELTVGQALPPPAHVMNAVPEPDNKPAEEKAHADPVKSEDVKHSPKPTHATHKAESKATSENANTNIHHEAKKLVDGHKTTVTAVPKKEESKALLKPQIEPKKKAVASTHVEIEKHKAVTATKKAKEAKSTLSHAETVKPVKAEKIIHSAEHKVSHEAMASAADTAHTAKQTNTLGGHDAAAKVQKADHVAKPQAEAVQDKVSHEVSHEVSTKAQIAQAVVPQADTPPVTDLRHMTEPTLAVGDKLKITVFGHPDVSGTFEVSADGTIAMPLLGQVTAQGMTVGALDDKITALLDKDYLVNPNVTLEVLGYQPFFILGQVEQPGSYAYQPGLDVRRAVAVARGFTSRANREEIKIIRSAGGKTIEFDAGPEVEVLPGDTIEVRRRWF